MDRLGIRLYVVAAVVAVLAVAAREWLSLSFLRVVYPSLLVALALAITGLVVRRSAARGASSPRLAAAQLGVAEARRYVVHDHAGGLHERVADRRPHESEASALQVLGHRA